MVDDNKRVSPSFALKSAEEFPNFELRPYAKFTRLHLAMKSRVKDLFRPFSFIYLFIFGPSLSID